MDLADDLRYCDPLTTPNVAKILMDAAATRIEELEKMKRPSIETIPLPSGPFILRVPEGTHEILDGLYDWLLEQGRNDVVVVALGEVEAEEWHYEQALGVITLPEGDTPQEAIRRARGHHDG